MSTSTDNCRRHFRDRHLGEWIQACDKMGVKITAKTVIHAVNAWRHPSTSLDSRVEADDVELVFTKEGFVDSLVEWIVSDDQVHDSQLVFSFIELKGISSL